MYLIIDLCIYKKKRFLRTFCNVQLLFCPFSSLVEVAPTCSNKCFFPPRGRHEPPLYAGGGLSYAWKTWRILKQAIYFPAYFGYFHGRYIRNITLITGIQIYKYLSSNTLRIQRWRFILPVKGFK